MNLLLGACTLFALLTVYFVFSMARHARRRRPLRATRSLAGGAASGALGGASVMLAFSYYGYERLVEEQPVAAIEFEQRGETDFVARLMIDGRIDRHFELRGNEWQLDARIVSWSPPATLLGLDPIYQLERISGRYARLADEQTASRTVYSLADDLPVDAWTFARRYPKLLPGVDAHYGTATYLPMADGARFDVSLTRNALIARPANAAADAAVGGWGD